MNVPAHVLESANNWEQIGERIMATAKAAKTKRGTGMVGGMFNREASAERKAKRAERREGVPSGGAVLLEELRTATAEAREVLAELQKASKKS